MKKYIELGSNVAVCQKWEESERDWGTRPDGFSLHLSVEGLKKYIAAYWNSMPDAIPDEYSRPDGQPYPVGISDEVMELLKENDGSARFYADYEYPGSGGIDGWLPVRN